MRTSLGQPVVIENVTGAGGSIGAGWVSRAVPDGYTLIIGIWTTHVVNGAIYALQYDVLNDFEPIALLANNPQVIVAKKSMPASDLRGLIAWLKANPDKASAGTAGVGSPQHVLGIFFPVKCLVVCGALLLPVVRATGVECSTCRRSKRANLSLIHEQSQLLPLIDEVVGTARQLADQNKNRLTAEAPGDLGSLTLTPCACGKSCSIY